MRTHLVGIGGVSMSGIARVLAAGGEIVSGCDRAESATLARLRDDGVTCYTPHDPTHLNGVQRLVVSTAVAADEPELAAARRASVPILHRAEALAQILAGHDQRIVVSGAHGKTTTSAMLAVAADTLGLDATFLVGGDVPQLGTNARRGGGGLCIAEGDESDRSLVSLGADAAVVLNIDLDHLDHYDSIADVQALFQQWAASLASSATLVIGDGVELSTPAHVERFGLGPGQGLRARSVATSPGRVEFSPSQGPGRVRLSVAGVHNAANACAAASALRAIGVPLDDAFAALERYAGAARRFQTVGQRDGFRVVDDYAHHPAELAATIDTARREQPRRLVVYFQPHMPWRTRAFAEQFAAALAGADAVVVSETYIARGQPQPNTSAKRIVELLQRRVGERTAVWASDYSAALTELRQLAKAGDLVLCCGAGPVDDVARRLAAG